MDDVEPSKQIETSGLDDKNLQPLPFEDLEAPNPISTTPPPKARWLGLVAILISGLLGGMIGFGTGELLGESSTWAILGMFIGCAIAAVGVGIIVNLTLQAMNEWQAVNHPETPTQTKK